MAGYSSVDDVRTEVWELIHEDTYVITSSGTATPEFVRFPDNQTKEIGTVVVLRNGVVTTSSWTFLAPDTLKFNPALQLKDVVTVHRNRWLTTVQINKVITDVYHLVNSRLVDLYEVPFADTPDHPPRVGTLSNQLAAATIRKRLFDSTQRDGDRRGEFLWREAMKQLDALVFAEPGKKTPDLLDKDGKLIAKKGTGFGLRTNTEDALPIFTLEDVRDINTYKRETGIWRDEIGRRETGD